MSDTVNICGLTINRGEKLRTLLPVPDTTVKIPITKMVMKTDLRCLSLPAYTAANILALLPLWSWDVILSQNI